MNEYVFDVWQVYKSGRHNDELYFHHIEVNSARSAEEALKFARERYPAIYANYYY